MNINKLATLQNPDGGFGYFHGMGASWRDVTTEKALKRMYFLGLDPSRLLLRKTLDYLNKCLSGEAKIPDRVEKVINWELFSELMFSGWLAFFDCLTEKARLIREKWREGIEAAVKEGKFNYHEYELAFQNVFGRKKARERILNPASFYLVALLKNHLSPEAAEAYCEYLLETGVYYIYSKPLRPLPGELADIRSFYLLEAVKLIAVYASDKRKFAYVWEWITRGRHPDGNWYLGELKADGMIFPVSGSWRDRVNKTRDVTRYLNAVLRALAI